MIPRQTIHQLWVMGCFGVMLLALALGPRAWNDRAVGPPPPPPVFGAAQQQIQDGTRRSPVSAYDYCVRAAEVAAQGNLENALVDYNAAIRVDPNYSYAYGGRAYVRHAQGKVNQALEDYNEAIRLDSNIAGNFLNRGLLWQQQKDLDQSAG